MTIDELAARMDEKFSGVDKQFEALKRKMKEGFDASRAGDEELRGLMKFGLEANEVLREDMHRRFDAGDRKHDEQITLLKDAVQHLTSRK